MFKHFCGFVIILITFSSVIVCWRSRRSHRPPGRGHNWSRARHHCSYDLSWGCDQPGWSSSSTFQNNYIQCRRRGGSCKWGHQRYWIWSCSSFSWGNKIFNITLFPRKVSSETILVWKWNRGPLKELNDSKLILFESKWFPWSSRINLYHSESSEVPYSTITPI